MREITELLKQKQKQVNQVLREIMRQQDFPSDLLREAMEYTLFSGGKRIRPVLTLLAAEFVEGDLDSALWAGGALELIHTYSLIHDDLPAMDDDDLRRGQPSNHRVYGPGIAVLAGDGLLTLAFEVLGELELEAEKINNIVRVVARGAGPSGMVGGQVLDLQGEDVQLDLVGLKQIHQNKTGALIKSSILAGAYCGSPQKRDLKALEVYAEHLGFLFQITDDILDVTGDQEQLGKDVGRDSELNKATYPSLLGLQEARNEAQRCAREARQALDYAGPQARKLQKLADFILDRDF